MFCSPLTGYQKVMPDHSVFLKKQNQHQMVPISHNPKTISGGFSLRAEQSSALPKKLWMQGGMQAIL
jgi:hypothetical protein